MNFQWASGFHAPKGVDPKKVAKAIDSLDELSPDALLHAAKHKAHVLHKALWSEGDQVWAYRGRLEYTRKIMASVEEVETKGSKVIEHRYVEFVRTSDGDRWALMKDILVNQELLDGYMLEIQRMNEQAAAKMTNLRALLF